MGNRNGQDLMERLILYSVRIIKVCEAIVPGPAKEHIYDQLLRSGTAVAANYAEAQGAESAKDFIHKVKLALKELREAMVWLRIIQKAPLIKSPSALDAILNESDELTAIFIKSVQTAQKSQREKQFVP